MASKRHWTDEIKMDPGDEPNDRVRALRRSYHRRLPERFREIDGYWERIQSGERGQELLYEFFRTVHSLAGSAMTFGFNDMGRTAQSLETICTSLMANPDETRPPGEIPELIDRIKTLASNPVDEIDIFG